MLTGAHITFVPLTRGLLPVAADPMLLGIQICRLRTVYRSLAVLNERVNLESQVAQNNGPLYPKVDRHWFKVAHNYKPLALQELF